MKDFLMPLKIDKKTKFGGTSLKKGSYYVINKELWDDMKKHLYVTAESLKSLYVVHDKDHDKNHDKKDHDNKN